MISEFKDNKQPGHVSLNMLAFTKTKTLSFILNLCWIHFRCRSKPVQLIDHGWFDFSMLNRGRNEQMIIKNDISNDEEETVTLRIVTWIENETRDPPGSSNSSGSRCYKKYGIMDLAREDL